MDGRRPRLGLPALGIAAGGVVAGHWLAYLMIRPEHHDRASLLTSTGHGHLAAAVEVAWLVAFVATAAAFLGRFIRRGPTPPLPSLAARLWMLQLGAFIVLEIGERAVAGTFDGLVAVCVVGTGAQFVVAVAGAWILRRLERTADIVARVLGRAPRSLLRGPAVPIRSMGTLAHRAPAFATAVIRGPPFRG